MQAGVGRLADEFSSSGAVGVVDRTFCLGHAEFELDDEFEEAVYEPGVIVLGISARELDHLAVAVGGLAELAAGLVDHAEPIVAIVHLGVANQQLSGGLFGLIEAAGMDQIDHGVGRRIQGLGFQQRGLVVLSLSSLVVLLSLQRDALANSGREFSRPILFQAAELVLLTAAARAGIVATGSWHSGSLLSRLGEMTATASPPSAGAACRLAHFLGDLASTAPLEESISITRRDQPSVPCLAARPEDPHAACSHRPRVRGAMSCRGLSMRWRSPPS